MTPGQDINFGVDRDTYQCVADALSGHNISVEPYHTLNTCALKYYNSLYSCLADALSPIYPDIPTTTVPATSPPVVLTPDEKAAVAYCDSRFKRNTTPWSDCLASQIADSVTKGIKPG